MKWRVRSGDKIKFWEDRWLGGEDSLAGKYPRLYRISSQQHQLVRQMGSHKDRGWEWNFTWRRSLFDSEIDLAVNFMREVDGKVKEHVIVENLKSYTCHMHMSLLHVSTSI